MNFDKARQTFIIEAQELLEAMEAALLADEPLDAGSEAVNALFRAVHTIKGSAGLFGLDHIVHFAHTVESVMDRLRDGKVEADSALVGLLLRCHDHLAQLIADLQAELPETPASAQAGEAILAGLLPWLGHALATPAPVLLPSAPDRDCWHISVRFGPDVLRNGMDPLSFIRYLGTLGRIHHLAPLLGSLPRTGYDPESCYLGLEIDLDSDADRKTIEDVFEFVQDDSEIRILAPNSRLEEFVDLIRNLPEEDRLLGETLVAGGSVTPHELAEALRIQKNESYEGGTVTNRLLGSILIQEHAVPPPVVAAALEKQRTTKDRQANDLKVVKVSADKLDRLVDLVGELVIAGATARARAGQLQDSALLETTATLNGLVEEIRDNALSLRMVQIGDTFNRFRRVVRDVSQELGKAIQLEIRGGDTELDKSIVEKLSDPLMHIVRNAIDHGIESPEVRRQHGKPDTATLVLSARHESGTIIIEVTDDGAGLDHGRILAKAREKGLIREDATLTPQEINHLIFLPGFSTAKAVSNLSGRGVGMDVVRSNIEELRGTVEIETEAGQGATLRLRLPLTLAIIDGFRVGVEAASYVLPLDLVIECLDLAPYLESEENHLINLRGEVLPFLRLREVFRIPGPRPARERVVVVEQGDFRAGLVVDRLLGEFQTVIKPLGRLFRSARGIGGSTILGSGEVALILDIPQLIQLACERPAPTR